MLDVVLLLNVIVEPGRVCEDIFMLDAMGWGFPRTNSSFLLVAEESAVVEPGCRSSANAIKEGIGSLGLEPDSFRYIFVSHRHFDHSGGAAQLLKYLSRSKVLAHEYTIETLKDPSRINQATRRAFGGYAEDIERVEDESRLQIVKDGEAIRLSGGLEVEVVATPGHTSCHLSFYEKRHGFMFVGDAAGIFNREKLSIIPTTFPPSFNYESYVRSIEKMLEYRPRIVAFAHYGAVKGSEAYTILEKALNTVEEWKTIAENSDGDASLLADRLREKYGEDFPVFPPEARIYVFPMLAVGLLKGVQERQP